MKISSMCRICLAVDVQMHLIRARHLQEMYESLSRIPLKTQDKRPTQACYICFSRLKNCYQLRQSCVRSEELLTEMLSSNKVNPAKLRERYASELLTVTPPVQMSLTDDVRRHAYSVVQRNCEAGVYYEVKVLPDEETDPLAADGELVDNMAAAKTERDVPRKIVTTDLDVTDKSAPVPETARTTQTKSQRTSTKDLQSSDRTDAVDGTNIDQQSSSNIDIVRYRSKAYLCHVCNKRYSRKCDLSLHISRHTGTIPYQCNDCQKFFTQKSVLATHISSVHSKELPFRCDVCKKAFRYKIGLDNHMRTHTGEKPYQCKVCDKYFSQIVTLKRHFTVHTGEKPHKCSLCEKSFARKCGLKLHFRLHTGEKPYQCHVCMKCYRSKSSLNSHVRYCMGKQEQSNPL